MNDFAIARARLDQATDIGGVLNASYGAFMTLLDAVKEQQDRGGPLFAAFVMAGVSVAGGRFAIAEAPSLSTSARMEPTTRSCDVGGPAEDTAAAIADLCWVMIRRLDDVALIADDVRDRRACRDASRHARALRACLGGAP
jgi:hypothetical protein